MLSTFFGIADTVPENTRSNLKTKPQEKTTAAPVGDAEEGDPSKENVRGGRPRGKDSFNRGGRGSRPPKVEGEAGAEEAPRRPRREFDRKSGSGRYNFNFFAIHIQPALAVIFSRYDSNTFPFPTQAIVMI